MEIIRLGRTLEIGKEIELKVKLNTKTIKLFCTPENVEELVIGFAISEGIAKNPIVRFENDLVVIETENDFDLALNTSGSFTTSSNLRKLNPKVKFKIDFVRRFIDVLNADYYERTRAYHTALIVNKSGEYLRAYDVGRHNAVDKTIGLAYKKNLSLSESFLVITGRITAGIAKKCVRAGIPLIVSKAAIVDSAIDVCRKANLSAISFATNIAVNCGAIEV